jgi:hypothetical protein
VIERRDWLIFNGTSECWWGPNRCGYWKSALDAGLYTEKEAKEQEAAAVRSQDRRDKAVHISELREGIERLAAALALATSLGELNAAREEGREVALRTLASAIRKVLSPELVALVEAEMRRGLARDVGIQCGNWTPQKFASDPQTPERETKNASR